MDPFNRHTNNTPPAYPTNPQIPTQYPQAPAQPPYPVSPTYSAPPLRPYGQQFQKKEEVDSNPYDFFLNPEESKKNKKAASITGNSIGTGKIIIVVGAMVSVVIIAIAVLIMSTKGSDSSPALLSIANDQQEIIHVTTSAETILESQSLINFAATARYSTMSAQAQYVEFLNKIGIKVETKSLQAATFPKIDQVLSAAQTASTYDTTFRSEMQTILAEYIDKLNQARTTSTTETQKNIFDKNIESTTLLQKQLAL